MSGRSTKKDFIYLLTVTNISFIESEVFFIYNRSEYCKITYIC